MANQDTKAHEIDTNHNFKIKLNQEGDLVNPQNNKASGSLLDSTSKPNEQSNPEITPEPAYKFNSKGED